MPLYRVTGDDALTGKRRAVLIEAPTPRDAEVRAVDAEGLTRLWTFKPPDQTATPDHVVEAVDSRAGGSGEWCAILFQVIGALNLVAAIVGLTLVLGRPFEAAAIFIGGVVGALVNFAIARGFTMLGETLDRLRSRAEHPRREVSG